MSTFKQKVGTHVVLKVEDIHNALSKAEILILSEMQSKVMAYRESHGKRAYPEYYVVNHDEPYAQKVSNEIVRGEIAKFAKTNNNIAHEEALNAVSYLKQDTWSCFIEEYIKQQQNTRTFDDAVKLILAQKKVYESQRQYVSSAAKGSITLKINTLNDLLKLMNNYKRS